MYVILCIIAALEPPTVITVDTCPRVFIAALKILWNFVPAAQQTYIQL